MKVGAKLQFSYRNKGHEDTVFYVPSDGEARAYVALQQGNKRQAQQLFDDAIDADPTRGARIYWTLRHAEAPLQDVYWGFCKADLERSRTQQESAVQDVRERRASRWTLGAAAWVHRLTTYLAPESKSKRE